jgi:hypothetical protein
LLSFAPACLQNRKVLNVCCWRQLFDRTGAQPDQTL